MIVINRPITAARTTPVRSRLAVLALAAMVAAGLSGCSQTAIAPQGHCSPSYEVGGAEGKLKVQQKGHGQAITWGIYVASKYKTGTVWAVKVRANGTNIDAKNQTYEPHGSVNAARAKKYSGKVLEISGTAVHNKDDILTFSGKCKIA
ncbi:hypothetical protein [Curtobacterium sp. PsM8]|uniref:hypothetical protein n=1 Tax=Curtobacterium sp. PsM8 TaxID=3030532 RepID=UPI00263A6B53|nr:hypothetical protein [Curtobacterium sp. PsM8]MDN4648150.1 hypothetical protein [Curtobacterium sp. PsM8]